MTHVISSYRCLPHTSKFMMSSIDTVFRNIENIVNLLKPTGHVMHHQINIQQLHALPTRYLCVLYLSESKQRHVPLTA